MIEEKVKKDIYTCASCGYCRFGCPVSFEVGFERMTARGRMLILKNIVEEKLTYTDEVIDSLYACSGCANCSEMCPTQIDYVEVIVKIREEIVKKDLLPNSQKLLRENLIKEHNPFGEKQTERGTFLPKSKQTPRKSKNLYFVGCSASYSSNRIPKSILRVLDTIGFDYTVLGKEEVCCGDPLERMGEVEKAHQFFQRNLERFKELEVETIFASCPGCYRNLKKNLSSNGFRVQHITELLFELVREGRISFKEFLRRVIYADGCDLGRQSGVFEEPREVIKSIPGVKLLEFDYNRKEAICCGGPISAGYPELAHKIAARKVKEAQEKKVDLIITACPMCFVNLKEGAKEAGVEIEVQDLPLLLPKLVKK
jgi:Fe-S oxidoreductase